MSRPTTIGGRPARAPAATLVAEPPGREWPLWHPEGDAGVALAVEAFGEVSGPLQVPAPLIRVPEGTEIVAEHPERSGRDAPGARALRPRRRACADRSTCRRPANATCVSRRATAGTYHYWATTTGMPLPFRGASDTQLSGAFIVDAAGRRRRSPTASSSITDWTSLTRAAAQAAGQRRRSRRRVPGHEPALHVPDQRTVVAIDRAADLSRSTTGSAGAS